MAFCFKSGIVEMNVFTSSLVGDYANAIKRKANIVELGDELESCIATPSDT